MGEANRSETYICPDCGAHPIITDYGYFCDHCNIEYDRRKDLSRLD